MTQVKSNKAPRLPHKMRQRLHEETGLQPNSISRIISKGDTAHPVWALYEKLLLEKVEAKTKEEREKQARLANVKKLRAQLAA
jgi:hypothetical protein